MFHLRLVKYSTLYMSDKEPSVFLCRKENLSASSFKQCLYGNLIVPVTVSLEGHGGFSLTPTLTFRMLMMGK